jgi:hypothetical protein
MQPALILHSYSRKRPEDQEETWRALEEIRQSYTVVDELCEGPYGYHDAIAKYWGKGRTILSVEMDIVPTLFDVEEILSCPETHCYFPHRISGTPEPYSTSRSTWSQELPYGYIYSLAFAKFTPAAQDLVPKGDWLHKTDWVTTDRCIEVPLIERSKRKMHLHERFVKHNHSASSWEELRRERNT